MPSPSRFEGCNKKGDLLEYIKPVPYTVMALALHLGFNSRTSLLNYCGYRDDESSMTEEEKTRREAFVNIIMRGKARIEEQNLKFGMLGEFEPKITALNLAANYGYNTKVEEKVDTTFRITFAEQRCIHLMA